MSLHDPDVDHGLVGPGPRQWPMSRRPMAWNKQRDLMWSDAKRPLPLSQRIPRLYADGTEAYEPEHVAVKLAHDTHDWKRSTGVYGARAPAITTVETLCKPSPVSRHTVSVQLHERDWSGEVFPTEMLKIERQKVRFLGFAYFPQDGRAQSHSEQEYLMWHAACSKYPNCRPATYEEYRELRIQGLPERNTSGAEVVFTGYTSRGDMPPKHRGWVLGGHPKRMVLSGDPFDGVTETGSAFGRKAILCVLPARRLVRQPSLRQWGELRYDLWKSRSQPDILAAKLEPDPASKGKTYSYSFASLPSSALNR